MLTGGVQKTSAGDFVMVIGSIFAMYRPIKLLTKLHNQMQQARAASERVFQLLNTRSDLPEPAHPVPLGAANADFILNTSTSTTMRSPPCRTFT